MKNLFVIILVALGILLAIGYEELGLDIGIGAKYQIVFGVLFLISAIALKFNFKALKIDLNKKGSELKKSKLEKLIENDPEIKKIDQEIRDLVDSQLPILLRLKKDHPDLWKLAVEKGLVGANLKDEDEDSNDEKLNLRDKSISNSKHKG
jgi:hypothetical protein